MTRIAVFGVGSTNFRYAVATPAGEYLAGPTVESTRPAALAEQVVAAVEDVRAGVGPLDAVAVSAPGLVDRDAGTIRKLDAPDGGTIPTVRVRDAVRDAHDLPVYLENDCNASVLAEWQFGSTPATDVVAHVTIGTGIGGGVVDRGHLVAGESAQAGEFGLFSVAPDDGLESTGVTGAWEAYCSGRGIPGFVEHLREAGELDDWATEDSALLEALDGGDDVTSQTVFTRAADGDPVADACLERIHRYNAVGVATVCNAFNPGLLTFGGGVALNNADAIVEGVERHLDQYLFVDSPEVRTTELGDDIGLYGSLATYLARADDPSAGAERQPARSTVD